MTESLMTEAAIPTEGQAASQTADVSTDAQAPADASATQQQADAQDQTAGQDGQAAGDSADDKAPEGAPEKYEFKAPDGQQFDPKVIESYAEVAKELNLSQDAAQKMLDKLGPVIQTRQAEQVEAIRSQWAEDAKADKEFGGDKLTENLASAKKALDQFGNAELRTLLNESGLGNHPEVIRFMVRAGKAISEDRYVGGGQGGKTGPRTFNDQAAALYPNQQ